MGDLVEKVRIRKKTKNPKSLFQGDRERRSFGLYKGSERVLRSVGIRITPQ